jgi:acyl-coenzyme A synthetase/AMP-(fatty) acid ligase
MPRFDFEDFLRDIERHRVTRIAVAPPIVLALAKDPAVNEHDLSSLKMIACGAAPLSRDVALECARRVGCRVKQMYGLTEAGPVTFSPDGGAARPESIGPLSPGVVARIVDPKTGRDVRAGAAGELWVRAPARMLGYLDNSEATAAMIDAQGWLHTGDVVYADTNGWLHVTDRIKELIKYKGHQVAPAELEAILLSHPAVADAAVVASSDEAAGEVPKAFVAIRSPVSAADLMEFVASQVSPYKRIRRLEFIERIPKSPSGKILRRLLMELEQGQTAVQAA